MKPIFSGDSAIAWYVGVVWQVITTFCLAILGIWLLWAKGVERQFRPESD
jgi:glycerol-3-phosphate acyltransferase PlsY